MIDDKKATILSGVSLDIYIDKILNRLTDTISPATSRMVNYESSDLLVRGDTVYVEEHTTGKTKPVARFINQADASTFIEHNSDQSRSAAHTQLNIIRKFQEARKNGDVDRQKELFEGIYLVASMNLGEVEARTLRSNFNQLIQRTALQLMVNAALSGYQGAEKICDFSEQISGSVERGGEGAVNTSRALNYLFDYATKDDTVVAIHEHITTALRSYQKELREKDGDHSEEINNIDELLAIFERLTLLPQHVDVVQSAEGGSLI